MLRSWQRSSISCQARKYQKSWWKSFSSLTCFWWVLEYCPAFWWVYSGIYFLSIKLKIFSSKQQTSLGILTSLVIPTNDLKVSWKKLFLLLLIGLFVYYFILTDFFEQSKDIKMVHVFLLVLSTIQINCCLIYRNLREIKERKVYWNSFGFLMVSFSSILPQDKIKELKNSPFLPRQFQNLFQPKTKVTKFLLFGEFWFILSTTSSSFIEEEHQIWYYLTNTLFILMIHEGLKKNKVLDWKILLNCPILFTHALIRRFNQTGDKWLSVPDIGDWLGMEEHFLWLNICFVLGLLLGFVFLKQFSTDWRTDFLVLLDLLIIFLFRTGIVGRWVKLDFSFFVCLISSLS